MHRINGSSGMPVCQCITINFAANKANCSRHTSEQEVKAKELVDRKEEKAERQIGRREEKT
ncbi:unnamed protein product [Penicillium palitans]